MRSAQSLDRMSRLVPEVAAGDLLRYLEIVGFLEAAPKRVPAPWLPLWNRALGRARADLVAILGRCCRDHHGEALARELLERMGDDGDPLE